MSKWGEGDINQQAEQYLLHYRSQGSRLPKKEKKQPKNDYLVFFFNVCACGGKSNVFSEYRSY